MNTPTLKQKLGCWLHERWLMEAVLRLSSFGQRWQDLCNRHEHVVPCDAEGRICSWPDSSFLTACKVFPRLGGRLLEHVAREYPFSLEMRKDVGPVSAIIPVRGTDRERALVFVAQALRAICGPESEVLVCEHDSEPRLKHLWPEGIRYLFIPAKAGEAFNKSKALNAGALAARHGLLLLHDADVWAPAGYVARCAQLMAQGNWEAVRPIRFLFLLDETQTQVCLGTGRMQGVREIARVQQNNPGLSSFVRRDTYLELGGHDERFTGWGWEDVEFLDRLQTRRLYPGSFLPAIHLWHAAPPAKKEGDWNSHLLRDILREPMAQRMETCCRQLASRSSP